MRVLLPSSTEPAVERRRSLDSSWARKASMLKASPGLPAWAKVLMSEGRLILSPECPYCPSGLRKQKNWLRLQIETYESMSFSAEIWLRLAKDHICKIDWFPWDSLMKTSCSRFRNCVGILCGYRSWKAVDEVVHCEYRRTGGEAGRLCGQVIPG